MSMTYADIFYTDRVDQVIESIGWYENGLLRFNDNDFDREMEKLKDEELNRLWEENKKLKSDMQSRNA